MSFNWKPRPPTVEEVTRHLLAHGILDRDMRGAYPREELTEMSGWVGVYVVRSQTPPTSMEDLPQIYRVWLDHDRSGDLCVYMTDHTTGESYTLDPESTRTECLEYAPAAVDMTPVDWA